MKQVRIVVQNVWNQDLEYNEENRNNDWIILKLDTPLDFNDEVQPACLPFPNWSPDTDSYNRCFVSGWGALEFEVNSTNTLQWIEVPALTNEVCKQSYGNESISDDIICAGYVEGGNNSWPGNSGGPLVCLNNESSAILTGIASFGHEFASPGHYGIYAPMTQILDWIQSNLVCVCNVSQSKSYEHLLLMFFFNFRDQ